MKNIFAFAVLVLGLTGLSAVAAENDNKSPKSTQPVIQPIDDLFVETKKPPVSFVAQVGFDWGGDDAFTVTYTNGRSDTVKFGDGVFGSLGALFCFAQTETGMIQLQPTFGIKYMTTSENSNQSISLIRFPLELMGFYSFEMGLRFGVGIKKDLAPKIHTNTTFTNVNGIDFDGKLGGVVQADYWFNDRFALGARYTAMKYEAPNGVNYNAQSVGLVGTFSP